MLPDLQADACEVRNAAGPVFAGKVYETVEDSVEALSRTAVRVGREAAGRPPSADDDHRRIQPLMNRTE